MTHQIQQSKSVSIKCNNVKVRPLGNSVIPYISGRPIPFVEKEEKKKSLSITNVGCMRLAVPGRNSNMPSPGNVSPVKKVCDIKN